MFQDVLRNLGEVESDPNTAIPKYKITIVDCGLNELDKKYDLTEEEADLTEDL